MLLTTTIPPDPGIRIIPVPYSRIRGYASEVTEIDGLGCVMDYIVLRRDDLFPEWLFAAALGQHLGEDVWDKLPGEDRVVFFIVKTNPRKG